MFLQGTFATCQRNLTDELRTFMKTCGRFFFFNRKWIYEQANSTMSTQKADVFPEHGAVTPEAAIRHQKSKDSVVVMTEYIMFPMLRLDPQKNSLMRVLKSKNPSLSKRKADYRDRARFCVQEIYLWTSVQ